MESFLVLIALIYGVGLPVGVIYLLVKTARLGRDNIDLTQRMRSAEKQLQAVLAEDGAPASAKTPEEKSSERPEQAATSDAQAKDRLPAKDLAATDVPGRASPKTPWEGASAEQATRKRVAKSVARGGAATGATGQNARATAEPAQITGFDRMLGQLGAWLAQNWVYAVAAVSLALAGIFLVQYGIENGLLPPTARVLAALGFGAAMVGAGEYLRKRWGDGDDSSAAFLPSVFSGAGIVTLFAGVLSARHLYDLIGPTTCFAGLLAVAIGAIILGWLTGPLLAALGVVGAFVAPFLLNGGGEPSPVVAHLGIVTLVGLAIDTYRRWHWLSALSLALGYLLIIPLAMVGAEPEWVIGFALVMPFASIMVMSWRLMPRLSGAALLPHIVQRRNLRGLPRRMALLQAVMAGSVVWLLLAADFGAVEFWAAMLALLVLSAGMAIWGRRCAAMEDLPILPALGLLGLVAVEGAGQGAVWRAFVAPIAEDPLVNGVARDLQNDLRLAPIWLATAAALIGVVAAWRSLSGVAHPRIWALIAAIFAPAMVVVLELTWSPASQIGAFRWALVVLALAALMVIKLERFARAGDEDRMRLSLVLISALGLISFALMLLLSPSALTVALAVTVLVSVEIDRRFDLPLLEWFAVLGTILVSARLVLHPGLSWADGAPIPQVSIAFLGAIVPLAAGWWLASERSRIRALVTMESAVLSLFAIFIALLLDRAIETATGVEYDQHWGVGLNALIWLLAAAVQAWRLQLGGRLVWIRTGLAGFYALLALGYLSKALLVDNPFTTYGEVVHGWPVLSTLTVAYALPALLLMAVARFMHHLPTQLRLGLLVGGAGLLTFWAVAEIAHFWRGAELAGMPMHQPELYTYTVALLLLGAGLLYQAIARTSDLLRRVAMGVIALTVAKVFLIDASGLDGLMRVFSFLALGLSLAGLAWLNRWAALRGRPPLKAES